MTHRIECSECGDEMDIRGYGGHLRMAHGITGEEMQRELNIKKSQNTHTTGNSQTVTADGGVTHAHQLTSNGSENPTEQDGSVTCTMCGRSSDVMPSEQVRKLLTARGHNSPQELSKYSHYCSECGYAFDGDSA